MFTTKEVFDLSLKLQTKQKLTQDELDLLRSLVEEKANKMKLLLRKNLMKYIYRYLSEEGHKESDTVEELIGSLSPDILSEVFKKGKQPAQGDVIYRDFIQFLNNCNRETTIEELLQSVV